MMSRYWPGDEVEIFVRRQAQEHRHDVGREPLHALDAARQALDHDLRHAAAGSRALRSSDPRWRRAPGTAGRSRRVLRPPSVRAAGRADTRLRPARMRARHDEQCPPLQLCGRFKPARSAASRIVSPSSTTEDLLRGQQRDARIVRHALASPRSLCRRSSQRRARIFGRFALRPTAKASASFSALTARSRSPSCSIRLASS